MSMSLYVVLGLSKAPSSVDINLAAKKSNVPIEIYTEDISNHLGYLPMRVSNIDSGVETYVYPAKEAEDILPNTEAIELDKSIVIQFRWGSDFKEAAAAFYTALILTSKYNGIAFDSESGMILDTDQIKQGAQVFKDMAERSV